MSSANSSGSFYQRTSVLQKSFHLKEAAAMAMFNETPVPLINSGNSRLQRYWLKVVQEGESRANRNRLLLDKLGKVEEHLTSLYNKSEALKKLKIEYEETLKSFESVGYQDINKRKSNQPSFGISQHAQPISDSGFESQMVFKPKTRSQTNISVQTELTGFCSNCAEKFGSAAIRPFNVEEVLNWSIDNEAFRNRIFSNSDKLIEGSKPKTKIVKSKSVEETDPKILLYQSETVLSQPKTVLSQPEAVLSQSEEVLNQIWASKEKESYSSSKQSLLDNLKLVPDCTVEDIEVYSNVQQNPQSSAQDIPIGVLALKNDTIVSATQKLPSQSTFLAENTVLKPNFDINQIRESSQDIKFVDNKTLIGTENEETLTRNIESVQSPSENETMFRNSHETEYLDNNFPDNTKNMMTANLAKNTERISVNVLPSHSLIKEKVELSETSGSDANDERDSASSEEGEQSDLDIMSKASSNSSFFNKQLPSGESNAYKALLSGNATNHSDGNANKVESDGEEEFEAMFAASVMSQNAERKLSTKSIETDLKGKDNENPCSGEKQISAAERRRIQQKMMKLGRDSDSDAEILPPITKLNPGESEVDDDFDFYG